MQTKEAFTVEGYKHTHTRTFTYTHTHTHTHTLESNKNTINIAENNYKNGYENVVVINECHTATKSSMKEFNNTINESNSNIVDIIKKSDSVYDGKNKEKTTEKIYFMGDSVVKHIKD